MDLNIDYLGSPSSNQIQSNELKKQVKPVETKPTKTIQPTPSIVPNNESTNSTRITPKIGLYNASIEFKTTSTSKPSTNPLSLYAKPTEYVQRFNVPVETSEEAEKKEDEEFERISALNKAKLLKSKSTSTTDKEEYKCSYVEDDDDDDSDSNGNSIYTDWDRQHLPANSKLHYYSAPAQKKPKKKKKVCNKVITKKPKQICEMVDLDDDDDGYNNSRSSSEYTDWDKQHLPANSKLHYYSAPAPKQKRKKQVCRNIEDPASLQKNIQQKNMRNKQNTQYSDDISGLVNKVQDSMNAKTYGMYDMVNNLNKKILELGTNNSKDFDVYDQYQNGKLFDQKGRYMWDKSPNNTSHSKLMNQNMQNDNYGNMSLFGPNMSQNSSMGNSLMSTISSNYFNTPLYNSNKNLQSNLRMNENNMISNPTISPEGSLNLMGVMTNGYMREQNNEMMQPLPYPQESQDLLNQRPSYYNSNNLNQLSGNILNSYNSEVGNSDYNNNKLYQSMTGLVDKRIFFGNNNGNLNMNNIGKTNQDLKQGVAALMNRIGVRNFN